MTSEATHKPPLWSPLKRPAFRALWIATCIAWLGRFMQEVAAAWLMTSLAPSPVMVSLLQTAFNLPFFLLALPAGALSDIVDKRVVMISSQLWTIFVVGALGALTLAGAMTPWLLLSLLLLVGIGAAINSPAFNALPPELVPGEEVEPAVSLVTASFSMMRGIGAAIGGVLVGLIGAGNVFAISALTMSCIVFVLIGLKNPKPIRTAPPENVLGAVKAGVRYLKHSTPLHAVLIRTAIFVSISSCLWALLPLIAREQLHLNAGEYGFLILVLGGGNMTGAALTPRLRRSLSQDAVAAFGTLALAVGISTLSLVDTFAMGCVAMLVAGVGWNTASSALNASLLNASPKWVRARVMSIFLLVFQGCLAGGALLWGVVASFTDINTALQATAAGLICSLAGSFFYSLTAAERSDMSAVETPEPPQFAIQPHPDHGPAVISVEYIIEIERLEEFNAAIAALEIKRRRDGAFAWHLYSDLERPGYYFEIYQVETWGEYLRQLERTTAADKAVEERVYAIHAGAAPPKVSHLISERRRSRAAKTKPLNLSTMAAINGLQHDLVEAGEAFVERRKN